MSDIEDIGTALPLVIKSVFELDERLKAVETDNMQQLLSQKFLKITTR